MKKWPHKCSGWKASDEDPSFCANCGNIASGHKEPTPGAPRSFRLSVPVKRVEKTEKLIVHGTEDEMVTIHRGGRYHDTFYASCPEHARDFHKAHPLSSWAEQNDLLRDWDAFAATWKSKYPDEG